MENFSCSLFNEDVNNCTMTSRLILPEHYVKGNAAHVSKAYACIYISRANNKKP